MIDSLYSCCVMRINDFFVCVGGVRVYSSVIAHFNLTEVFYWGSNLSHEGKARARRITLFKCSYLR